MQSQLEKHFHSHFFNKDIYCLHSNNLPLFSKQKKRKANTFFDIKNI